jgi:hypothetical protein
VRYPARKAGAVASHLRFPSVSALASVGPTLRPPHRLEGFNGIGDGRELARFLRAFGAAAKGIDALWPELMPYGLRRRAKSGSRKRASMNECRRLDCNRTQCGVTSR